jgi:hypothetical protein
MLEVLANLSRARAKSAQWFSGQLSPLQQADHLRHDRNIRKALHSAKDLRLALEASRKAAAIAQEAAPVPVLDRSQY